MRRTAMLILGLFVVTFPVAGQASQFGVRGLGLPGRGLSAKALGSGGAGGMFEGEDIRNPSSPTFLTGTSATFTTSGSWRSSSNPVAEGISNRDTRFPLLSVGGRVPGTRLALGINQSLLLDRDFTVITQGVAVPRGEAILYTDTLRSRGGVSDLRLQAAWRPALSLSVGAGIDFVTGQNQVMQRRVWADTIYQGVRVSGEASLRGIGATAGLTWRPNSRLELAGSLQWLGDLEIRQDSLDQTMEVPMPMTVTGAARFLLTPAIRLSAMATQRNWDRSNQALRQHNGSGARSTSELAGGVEWARNARDPESLPLRVGARVATLPFPLELGGQPREWGVSVGTGIRFGNQRGGVDFALERIQRNESSQYPERAWQMTVGVTVRTPNGN